VSRKLMDKAEIAVNGAVSSTTNGVDGVCAGCHGNEKNKVDCGNLKWKEHLTKGRVAHSVWEEVTDDLVNPGTEGDTCGW